jgi:hypothetical protein
MPLCAVHLKKLPTLFKKKGEKSPSELTGIALTPFLALTSSSALRVPPPKEDRLRRRAFNCQPNGHAAKIPRSLIFNSQFSI